MNDSINDLEQLRRDWQEGANPPPEVTLSALRRRLSRRWLLVGFEIVALAATLIVLVWSASRMQGWMDWIYWSVFAAVWIFGFAGTVKIRMRSLWREDDTTESLVDHARRDARAREIGGRVALWLVPSMWVFVMGWTVVFGLNSSEPLEHFLSSRWEALLLLTAFFAVGALLGAWSREKGRRQLLELDRLVRDLGD